MKETVKEVIRQGDVVLLRLQDTDTGNNTSEKTSISSVLKTGEASGTAHILRGKHTWVSQDTVEVLGSDGAMLVHEGERAHHQTIKLPPGKYRFLSEIPREIRENEIRRVAD